MPTIPMTKVILLAAIAFTLCRPMLAIGQEPKAKAEVFEATTPEIAVSTFYLSAAKNDLELLRTVDREPTWAKPEELAKLGRLIVGFRITARSPMKAGQDVRPDDIYIRTEEYFAGLQKPGKRHFHLRKAGKGWTIVNFNVD